MCMCGYLGLQVGGCLGFRAYGYLAFHAVNVTRLTTCLQALEPGNPPTGLVSLGCP